MGRPVNERVDGVANADRRGDCLTDARLLSTTKKRLAQSCVSRCKKMNCYSYLVGAGGGVTVIVLSTLLTP